MHQPRTPKKLPPDDKTTHFYAAGAQTPSGPAGSGGQAGGGGSAGARGGMKFGDHMKKHDQWGAREAWSPRQAGARAPAFPKHGAKGFGPHYTAGSTGGIASTQMGARMGKAKGEADYQRGPRQTGMSAKTTQGTRGENLKSKGPVVDRHTKSGDYGLPGKTQYGARTPQVPALPGMTPLGIRPSKPPPPPPPSKQSGSSDEQYGARMPSHMHALTIASATHLGRAGHLDKKQVAAIHSKARNSMAAMRMSAAPMPGAGGAGAMTQGVGAAPAGPSVGQMPMFGSLDLGQQAGARR